MKKQNGKVMSIGDLRNNILRSHSSDCDIKALIAVSKAYHHNIYALVRQTSLAKDFGEKIKTAHDRKSVNQSKNERWQFQVNTKFLTHPDERSKFVTDVKLVNVFQKGDDPIDAINHMMSFLTAVVTSRYPTTNNQLRNSSNPRQQATINNGRVTLQPIQGRQTSFAAGTSRTYTPGASGSNSGKQRTVICYNCKGEDLRVLRLVSEPVTMSSATSDVTYTSVYTDSEPGRAFWGADYEEISEGGIPRVIVLGYDGLPLQL
ncbi:hypothetical protein Tco_0968927 [Tanacetum coccineum]